jgi:predicted deacylase
MVRANAVSAESSGSSESTAAVWSKSTIGRSVRRRAIVAYRFGFGPRRLLIIGGVHGTESGDDVALALIKRLKAHPSLVPSGTQIHVIPVLNPDGVARHSRGNARRVDLNRNMPTADWRRVLDRGDPSRRWGYTGGRSAGSEPENRALIAYVTSQGPFELMISLHSRGGIVTGSGSISQAYAARFSADSGIHRGRLSYDRHIHGSHSKYFSEVLGTSAITVELDSKRLGGRLAHALCDALGDPPRVEEGT